MRVVALTRGGRRNSNGGLLGADRTTTSASNLWRRSLSRKAGCGVTATGKEAQVKKSPWHSIKQVVYHNDTNCNTGNNIERENLRSGTGGKPLCKECARLK